MNERSAYRWRLNQPCDDAVMRLPSTLVHTAVNGKLWPGGGTSVTSRRLAAASFWPRVAGRRNGRSPGSGARAGPLRADVRAATTGDRAPEEILADRRPGVCHLLQPDAGADEGRVGSDAVACQVVRAV